MRRRAAEAVASLGGGAGALAQSSASVLLLGLCVLFVGSVPAYGRVLRVAKDGSSDYSLIQAAVNAAAPGDTVYIAAGRYTEHTSSLAWGQPSREACVVVSRDELTLIGESPETVLIGPETYEYADYGPIGIGGTTSNRTLRVERVGLVNCYFHIFKTQGRAEIRECRPRGAGQGVSLRDCESGLIEGCSFEDNLDGIVIHSCSSVVARDCNFIDCGSLQYHGRAIYAIYSSDVSIMRCNIQGGFVGVGCDWSTALISGCQVGLNGGYGVESVGGNTEVVLEDCRITGSLAPLGADAGATVQGTRLVLQGSLETCSFAQSSVTLRDCHILNGGGWSVKLYDDVRYSPGTYDLSGNWWGTVGSAQIDAWIYDANDRPQIGGVVQYAPFLDHPVGTMSKTLGGIKGMFR